MADKKRADNEKLIQELYEKLWWYTYEADEKDFNAQEVDAIVQLLEVLEPIGEDPDLEPGADAAFERFRARYGLDAGPENAGDAEDTEDGKKSGTEKDNEKTTISEKSDETEKNDRSEKKDTGRIRRRRRLFRMGGAAAASVALVLSLNLGAYALREKSFFEVVLDTVGAREVIVTGNEGGLEQVEENNTADIECDTWDEVEEIIGEKILKVDFLPEGYKLDEIKIKILQEDKHIIAKYNNDGNFFTIGIYVYSSNYSRSMMEHDEGWKLIKEDAAGKRTQYYIKEDKIEAFFLSGKGVYYVLSNEDLEIVEKVVNAMK